MSSSSTSSPSTPHRVHRLRLARENVKAPLAPLIRRDILRPRNYEHSVDFTDLTEFGSSFWTKAANDLFKHTVRTTSSNAAANDDEVRAKFQNSQDESQRLTVVWKENSGTVNEESEEKKTKSTNTEDNLEYPSSSNLQESTRTHTLEPTQDEGLHFHVRKVPRRGAANQQNKEQEHLEMGSATQFKD